MFSRIKEAAQEAKNKLEQNLSIDNEGNCQMIVSGLLEGQPTTGNSGQGDFQCPVCRKRFSDPELLIQHHSTHDGDNFASTPTVDAAPVSRPVANSPSHAENNLINEIKELKAQLLQKEHGRKPNVNIIS